MPSVGVDASGATASRCTKTWAMLIKRVYEVDPLSCPRCCSEMAVVALIDPWSEPESMRVITYRKVRIMYVKRVLMLSLVFGVLLGATAVAIEKPNVVIIYGDLEYSGRNSAGGETSCAYRDCHAG